MEEMKKFSALIDENLTVIKASMRWDNYNLNDTIIEVTEQVKDDAIMILKQNYGRNEIEVERLDDILSDIFVFFPILLQQLSITRLIDAYGVVKDDTDSIETTRTENIQSEVDQNSNLTQGTSQSDSNIINTQNKTTGTVSVTEDNSNNQESLTTIQNSSDIESTGSRNVSLSHNMPEQSLYGTANFPSDNEGTPILTTSYVQQAQEGFTTSNPIKSIEASEQNIINSDTMLGNNLTTNDITVANTGTNSRTVVNSGTDSSDSKTNTVGTNTITERVESITTNKQYAYEIKAFLETAESKVAFNEWIKNFSWLEGIV